GAGDGQQQERGAQRGGESDGEPEHELPGYGVGERRMVAQAIVHEDAEGIPADDPQADGQAERADAGGEEQALAGEADVGDEEHQLQRVGAGHKARLGPVAQPEGDRPDPVLDTSEGSEGVEPAPALAVAQPDEGDGGPEG